MASFTLGERPTIKQPEEIRSIIRSINDEFGFSIPYDVEINPHQPSDEELCHLRIRPLVENVTAVYQCIEHLRQVRDWNPQFAKSELVNSLAKFLKHQLVQLSGPGSSAIQSFGPTVSHRAQQEGSTIFQRATQAKDDTQESDTDSDPSFDEPNETVTGTNLIAKSQAPQGPREHWHSHRLPNGGLFIPGMQDCPSLLQAPFAIRYECTRLAVAYKLGLKAVDDLYGTLLRSPKSKLQRVRSGPLKRTSPWHDLSVLYKDIRSLASNLQPPTGSSETAWQAALSGSAQMNLSARLVFEAGTKNTSGIFRLQLSPLRVQPTSNRFFRKFGASRFIMIKVPNFRTPPSHLPIGDNPLHSRLLEWLGNSHGKVFAGNQWSFVHLQPVKNKTSKQDQSLTKADDAYDALFFATSGPGLEQISIKKLVSWFMPLELNLTSTFAKAYARLTLGLSKTYSAMEFAPEQVHYVDDQYGDSTPEATRFNDHRYVFANRYDFRRPKVMNDGCSRISYAAAKEAWQHIVHTRGLPVPSAFQGRIGPAKGVWMVESADYVDNGTYGPIWIEITASQKKFQPHQEDLPQTKGPHDPHRLTFEIVSWSQPRPSSKIYKEFCPLMEECGVPRDIMKAKMVESLEQENSTIDAALENKELLVRWLQSLEGTLDYHESMAWPKKDVDKIRTMINAGFDPKCSSHLAELCSKVILGHLSQVCIDMRAESECSTYILGVADPFRCLAPGEVHMYFSESVSLPNNRRGTVLSNVESLVARHPAMRPSDLQKIRVVFRPELAHLIDVAVFPTKGSTPLASKLQGGDYDGDKFWFCWEPSFVRDFRNRPIPVMEPDAAALGVGQDRRTLGEVLEDGGVTRFLLEGASLQLRDQLLGLVTNTHTRITHAHHRQQPIGIDALTALRNVLVDSSKNGYIFESKDFDAFLLKHLPGVNKRLPDPAWKTATTRKSEQVCESMLSQRHYNRHNIIDWLIFEVACPLGQEIHRRLRDKMHATARGEDEDLAVPYLSAMNSGETPILLREALANLAKDLNRIMTQYWNPSWCFATENKSEQNKRFESIYRILRSAVSKLRPRWKTADQSTDLLLHMLTLPTGQVGPSNWDILKASAFWCIRGGMSATPVFEMCGNYLCYIKAHSRITTTSTNEELQGMMPVYVDRKIMSSMKMRRLKAQKSAYDADVNENLEEETDEVNDDGQVDAADVEMVDAEVGGASDQGWTAQHQQLRSYVEGNSHSDTRGHRRGVQSSFCVDGRSARVVDELSQRFGNSLGRFSG